MTERDAERLRDRLGVLVGQTAWGVAIGHGTFLTMEFGAARPAARPGGKAHGEWHLWLYMTAWRIDGADAALGGSDDARERMEAAAGALERQVVSGVDVAAPAGDLTLRFAAGTLRTFAVSTGVEQWMLYLPDGNVAAVGPGQGWSEKPASQP